MWKIVSNPEYVANPAKGSVHNRGRTVDITLVDATGKEGYMGTSFDFLESKRVISQCIYGVKKNKFLSEHL
jgi:D-alanyl-D-alanine dipeptidase